MSIILSKLEAIFARVGRFETKTKVEEFYLNKKEFEIKVRLDLKFGVF